MSDRQIDVYAACDKAIRAMNRENLKAFGTLKLAKWDQMNVIQEVTTVYRESWKKARQRYYEIAFEAYLLAMALCGMAPKEAHRRAEKSITGDWVDEILEQVDFVTLYRFDTETERKSQRLIEALVATENRNAEIDRALRLWSRQVGQYAINFTDYAMLQAYDDAGVTDVEWVTAKDEKVCKECSALDGKIFALEDVPAKPHWNCRCTLKPVLPFT